MAESYTTAGSSSGVQVLSQTQVQPVQLVSIYTKPHGSYVVVPVPQAAWAAGDEAKYLEPVAANIEELWRQTVISGTSFVQDVDASGLLAAYVDFLVQLHDAKGVPLPFSTTVRVPLTDLGSASFFGKPSGGTAPSTAILQAFAQLEKTAGL